MLCHFKKMSIKQGLKTQYFVILKKIYRKNNNCRVAMTTSYVHSQKRHRLAASCGLYRLAESCHQVAASLLTSSSCTKSVRIRLAAT